MKTFTIDAENNITAYNSRKEAKETSLSAFGTEEQFADLIGNDNQRLLEIWNTLPGVIPVKKFANRKIATERIWKAIQSLGGRDTVNLEHQATIESATDHVGKDQAAPEADQQLASAGAQAAHVAPVKSKASKKSAPAKGAPKGKRAARGKDKAGPRQGSKMAQVIAMLQRKGGATLVEIMEKMSWQRHTVRGFVAGAMKKAGYTVESFKPEGGEHTYRIQGEGR